MLVLSGKRTAWLLATAVGLMAPGPARAGVVVKADAAAPLVAGTAWDAVRDRLEAGDSDGTAAALAKAKKAGLPASPEARRAALLLEARVALEGKDASGAAKILSELAAAKDPVAAPWLALRAIEAGVQAGWGERPLMSLLSRIPKGHPASPAARLAVAQVVAEAPAPVAADGGVAAGAGTGHADAGAGASHSGTGATDAGSLAPDGGAASPAVTAATRALSILGPATRYPRSLRPKVLALRARLFERTGRPAQARALWLRLYLEHPETPAARPAAARLAALAGPKEKPPAVAVEISRVERLLAAHQNEAAIDAATRLLDRVRPKSQLGCRLRFDLGKANRMARYYRQAISVLSKVVHDCHAPAIRVKALYLWASAASIALKLPAIPIYRRLVNHFPHHPYADDSLFFIADLEIHAGQMARARRTLESEVRRYPNGDYRGEALWRLFWLHVLDGHPARGIRWLNVILKDFASAKDTFDVERASYWKARTLAGLGRKKRAAALYARLVRAHPLSYHAVMAVARLRALDPARAKKLVASLPAPPADPPGFSIEVPKAFAKDPALADGIHLLRLGLDDAAAKVLEKAAPRARKRSEVLLLSLLLDRAGDAHGAHWLIRTRDPGFDAHYPQGQGWDVWRAAYPLAFRSEIEEATHRFGVPADLQQAIIREESALDPKVVSWAGAVGLAQLMPATARDIARRIHRKGRLTVGDLKKPQVNLTLSARYLADLLRVCHGNVALAIASYNAGERTVLAWARRHEGWPLDRFIEGISIAETRRYTRRVLRTYATYHYLYGTAGSRFLSLPAKVKLK